MKSKKIITIIFALIGVFLVLVIYQKLTKPVNDKFIYKLDFLEIKNIETGYVFTNYEDLKQKINFEELTIKDFKKNNYVFLELRQTECYQTHLTPNDYNISNNIINVSVKYTPWCGECILETNYYLLKVSKNIEKVSVNIDYEDVEEIDCSNFEDVAFKPIIYLYPPKKTDVTIKFINESILTTTYPKYKNNWEVTAYPNGKLVDQNKREYYGLYWEGKNHKGSIKTDGFIVKGEDTINFLEEKLSILGLNEREANEFIIYWLPKLEVNKYNYIRFETMEEINLYAPLEINPKPDNIIRIFMDYKPLKEEIKVEEQILKTPQRFGFTVVEWGGGLI